MHVRGVFLRLKKIWSSNSISQRTKVRLYKTLVRPVLMYGYETWKINKNDENKIDVFQGRCLRRIIKIRWHKRITDIARACEGDGGNLSATS